MLREESHWLFIIYLKSFHCALTVAQWVGHCPANRKIAGSVSSQGTSLGCRFNPQLGACERQLNDVSLAHQCFSPSLTPSLSPSSK